MDQTHPFRPGILEVYCGPMKSGKTRELINRVDKLDYLPYKSRFFKPSIDTRSTTIHSRFLNGGREIPCELIEQDRPYNILSSVEGVDLVVIDEAQFFSISLSDVVEKLVREKKNVIIGGLDLDFRGEPFGPMPQLLARADFVRKLTAVCEYNEAKRCDRLASRTQKLINGRPARYDTRLEAIEGKEQGISYQARCLEHHFVPK